MKKSSPKAKNQARTTRTPRVAPKHAAWSIRLAKAKAGHKHSPTGCDGGDD